MSADYIGTGLCPQAWENPLLSKITQLQEQPITNRHRSNHQELLVAMHRQNNLPSRRVFMLKLLLYSQFLGLCVQTCASGCVELETVDETDR